MARGPRTLALTMRTRPGPARLTSCAPAGCGRPGWHPPSSDMFSFWAPALAVYKAVWLRTEEVRIPGEEARSSPASWWRARVRGQAPVLCCAVPSHVLSSYRWPGKEHRESRAGRSSCSCGGPFRGPAPGSDPQQAALPLTDHPPPPRRATTCREGSEVFPGSAVRAPGETAVNQSRGLTLRITTQLKFFVESLKCIP